MVSRIQTGFVPVPARSSQTPGPAGPPDEPARDSQANPWPALQQALKTARGAAVSGTGPLAPALEAALQRFERAGLSFKEDSFKPGPVLPREAVQRILDGSSVKVAFPNGALARLKSTDDLRVLDGLVGLGASLLEPHERETLQVLNSLRSRGYQERHYGSDPAEPLADSLEALQTLRASNSVTLAGPGNESFTAASLELLKTMDYLTGGPDWPLAARARARTLLDASRHGLLFYRYSRPCTPYEQFKDDGSEVSVGRPGTPRVSLPLERLTDLKGTDELLEQAGMLHRERLGELYELLKVTDTPPPIPASWAALRAKFSPEVADAASCELLQAAALSGQTGYHSVEKVWQLGARMGGFARDDYQLACLAAGLAPVLANARQEDADRALLRLVAFDRERDLNPEEKTSLLTLLQGCRSISAAQEGLDLVRIPLGGDSLEEREQVFLGMARWLAPAAQHRTAEFYRCLLAECLPGESLKVTGDRLGRIYQACQSESRENEALGAFRNIQRKLREQPHTLEETDVLVQRFLHALLLGRNTRDALASLHEDRAAASVASGERFVTIGGVRVPRRKA